MFKKKLIWHLYPAFLIIGIAVLLAVSLYSAHIFHLFYYSQTANDLRVRANLVEPQVRSLIKSGSFSEVDDICKSFGKKVNTRITVILPDGRVIGDSDEDPAVMKDHSDRPEFRNALNEGSGESIRFSSTVDKNMMYLAIPAKENEKIIAVIRTSIPTSLIDRELSKFYGSVFAAGIIIAVCAAIVSLFVSRKLTQPIENMKETARQFASGDFSHRLALPDATELSELANALNEMAQQLKSRIETITEDKSRLHAILTSMIEGVLAVDAEGCVITINKAGMDFLDIGQEQVIGRNVEEVIRNTEIQQFVQNTLRGAGISDLAGVFVINDNERYFQLHGTSLTDSKGQKSGAVIVLNDITQMHRLEQIRSDFVANVSHELKTPITSIKGFVETLQEGSLDDPQEAKRFLEIIARHTDRLNAIVDDLLSLSRLEEDRENRRLFFEYSYLKPVLTSAVKLSKIKAEKKNITVELICDDNIAVNINSVLIEQAVFNLIDNAVKYSGDNNNIKITAQKQDKEVLISVSDNGCGIESRHLSRIFERFYVVDKGRSRKLGGTGLGLSIVKHISQVHGGSITVESRLNEGSTFTIHLPE
ncbi:MAG: ATP-binding protein [Phycisphaerae bacterium]|jgi:two-component system phosphate regulon sensor histidine kinase PhoR